LIRQRHFSLESFYSGMPSTTPAVQGEIFYGRRGAVPAFHFLQRARGRALKMYEADVATEFGAKLEQEAGPALLAGGRSYSNVYRAGAARSRYCAEDFAPNEILRKLHPFKSLLLSVVYTPKILRMFGLALVEFALALVDLFKGLYRRRNFVKEFQFVPSRVGVCVVLRELIRFRIMLDIERGERVVHANFLGYDEQAHRRGPDSGFAHWSLKGIDGAIRDIYRAAHRSDYRDYELIIYSDHGQERTESFVQRHGRSLPAALAEAFAGGPAGGLDVWQRPAPIPELMGQTVERCEAFLGLRRDEAQGGHYVPDVAHQIVVTAMGPVGHVYVPRDLSESQKMVYARRLVAAGVPLVLLSDRAGEVRAFNAKGEWELSKDQKHVFGAGHPFLEEVARDTAQLCRHPDAGDFVISGWDPEQAALSFPLENGAHGGPGPEETHGFLLLPDRIRRWHLAHLPRTAQRVRGEELREIALHYLGGEGPREERVPVASQSRDADSGLRIMSYNLHSCRGLDGKVRPERIARVINAYDPDLVAVQEVDAHRASSGSQDQAHLIARHLRMGHVFQTMLEKEGEGYGIAIFSKHPFEKIRAGFLTPAAHRREGRGAICLRVRPARGRPFYFINTHFGLGRTERREQAERLLDDQWLGGIPADEPAILCGDFNSRPRSKVYRRLAGRLDDVWRRVENIRARPGFPSIMPVLRLDHIFLSDHFAVRKVEVPRTTISSVASDHLPLCAELTWTDSDGG
ncbi:MAG TPA: endonuclease/exonuclease/phosphatase family protein, partial [Opitutales bacterium]|nr:endonuclease/exonuclease/phosphatase family protein [Opitutales bacterium]